MFGMSIRPVNAWEAMAREVGEARRDDSWRGNRRLVDAFSFVLARDVGETWRDEERVVGAARDARDTEDGACLLAVAR